MHTVSFLPLVIKSSLLSALFAGCFCGISGNAQETPVSTKPDAPIDAASSSVGKAASSSTSSAVAPDNKPVDPAVGTKTTQAPSRSTSKDRLFFLLPNFLTVEDAGKVAPLSTEEKYNVVARGSFDYVKYFWFGALAGIDQANNSDAGYGQGMKGYAKRYGAAFGDSTIEDFLTGAVLPSVLHQDPRYYQLGKGGFWHRTGYAVSRIFITRTDAGVNQFNYSEVFGSAAAAGISTYTYHPRSDRTLSNAASVWGTQVGLDTLTTVLHEFWPDIRRKLHGSKSPTTH
jgi:hypothetical protein